MDITLAEKIEFLRQPSSYPGQPVAVEVRETHHSWVFLAESYVYKMKKPVDNEFYDYTTVEKRHENCREEVRLNRRLAREIYLAVVPLSADENRRLELNGDREIVDWLVKMTRIPSQNMLDQSIEEGTVTEEEVDRAADHLAQFYRRALPVHIDYPAQRRQLEREARVSREQLSKPVFQLETGMIAEVSDILKSFLLERRAIFQQRLADGRIVEGHGDLRPEHICLRPRPYCIDCLEFNRDLRILDPVDDLSYLCLECEMMGAAWVGERFMEKYRAVAKDRAPQALLHFYRALRAFVKARLAAAHILELQYQAEEDTWIEKARSYLVCALNNVRLL